MDIRISFGNRIRNLRKLHNMSQEDLCEILVINTSSLSALETGKSFPSYTTIMKLCEAFRILPKELFDFNLTTIDSEQQDIIHELNTVLPELDSEKLHYLNSIARMFANKD